MKPQKNSFFIHIMLMQFCFLYSSYELHQVSNNMPHVEMSFNQQDKIRSNSYQFSCSISQGTQRSSYNYQVNHSVIEQCASDKLKEHFVTVITSKIYDATVNNYHFIIPGYVSPHGLRDCTKQLSQFSGSDAAVIEHVQTRLYSYCGRIENILFDAHGLYRDQLLHRDHVALLHVYADFLKEFYAQGAVYLFCDQSKNNPLMQKAVSRIDWDLYDGRDYTSSSKTIDKRNAGSVNGNLGAVYKALKAGDSEQAYAIGQRRVQIKVPGKIWGKTESITSVFEKYPDLKKVVEQRYFADKAKAQQELAVKQAAVQQGAALVQVECENLIDCVSFASHSDTLQDRHDSAAGNVLDPQFFKKIHKLLLKDAVHINSEHLTADQKGILIEGGHLQHHLVDETISVVDTTISSNLNENLQDAVIELANASLTSNKSGDVVTASRTLDACWAIIDFGKKAVGYAYRTVTTHGPLIAQGMYDGVSESLRGAAHAVCHPLATAEDIGNSFVTVGYCLGKAIYSAAEYEGVADLGETHPHIACAMVQKLVDEPSVLPILYEQAKTMSTQDVARVGTKTVVDMMLLHGAIKVVSVIAKEALPVFLSCMRKGAQSADIAITTEGIPVRCAEEVSSLMSGLEKVGGATTKVITESRMLIENMANLLMSELKAEIIMLREKFACVQNCLPNCAKKGFAEFKNGHIKIPYEHILGIELKWNELKGTLSGISGFHHDFMGTLEKSGLLKFVRKGVEKNGCYLVDIILDGSRIPGKTFFPQHWSREKVVSKIYEAYDNFIKSGAIPELNNKGKYVINGYTNEGIEIQMFITKNGQMATAYPIVEASIGI